MKIAVTGKGGVGKTTLSATLAHLYAGEGKKVLAVDADPDANLAGAFGIPQERLAGLRPIAEMTDLIEERTGARPGAPGGVYRINPKVDDIPEGFGLRFGNIILLVTGRSKEAASGCYCPENVLLRRLLKHLVVERNEVVVIDMEAGIEHLTRGTAQGVNAFIVVVEPGQRSIQTALTVKELAKGLGIKKVFAVANKIKSADELDFIKNAIRDIPILGSISYNPAIVEADIKGAAPFEHSPVLVSEVAEIKKKIEQSFENG
ncbi:MAG: carbon monoxide dehydrogenase accessory protein CooC [Nitrospiraceae bacterium]|nr:carbon monoxide dehydrogenase accessory protein CooC [Nitrospiraceae bacterium]